MKMLYQWCIHISNRWVRFGTNLRAVWAVPRYCSTQFHGLTRSEWWGQGLIVAARPMGSCRLSSYHFPNISELMWAEWLMIMVSIVKIQVSVQILILLIFYSSQFILLIFSFMWAFATNQSLLWLLWILCLYIFTRVWLCDLSSFPETEVWVHGFFTIIYGFSLLF